MQQIGCVFAYGSERHWALLAGVTTYHHCLVLIQIARSELQAQRNPTQLPFVVLGARLHPLAIIDVHSQPPRHSALPTQQAFLDQVRGGFDTSLVLVRAPYRDDHYFDWRKQRRHSKSIVVTVRHYQPANHARRHAPTRVPGVFHSAGFRLELEVERLREVLSQVMRSASLKRLVVLHHAFARVGAQRTGEFFSLGLHARNYGHRHPAFHEIAIDAQHSPRFFLRLVVSGVRGVAFLPEEFERAQEKPRAHLPPNDIGPLIDQHWKIAIALHPLGVHRVDDCLRGRTNDQRLLEFFSSAVRNDSSLGSKAFDVFGLLV